MKLIGMLDSPYVRRVAISFDCLGIPFEHQAVSVFSTFEQFQRINPVVKAPTLVFDDGAVLMDSTLILDYAEALAAPGCSLMPADLAQRRQALRTIGLALAACEKAVQLVYERNLRPADKQHAPWIARVGGQLLAAAAGLEREIGADPMAAEASAVSQTGITTAVVWRFMQMMLPEVVIAAEHPQLTQFSLQAERHKAFIAYPPVGPGVAARD